MTPVEAGAPAPFPGLLFPIGRALRLGAKVEACEFQLNQDRALFERRLAVETSAGTAAGDIRVAGAEERAAAALQALEDYKTANAREWWDQPGFIFWGGVGAGVLTTAVLSVGAVLTVGYLRPALPPGDATVWP